MGRREPSPPDRRSRGDGVRAQAPCLTVRSSLLPRPAASGVHSNRRRSGVVNLTCLWEERPMATLTAWKFETPEGAAEAENILVGLSKQELIKVYDAATV